MIGDFFGGVSPGDIAGFLANLAYGWIPYKVWELIGRGQSPISRSPIAIVKYVVACLAASVLCADLVVWADNVLVIRPFAMLGNVIIFNNMASALVLSPFILAAVYPRVKKGRMLYTDMMPEVKPKPVAKKTTPEREAVEGLRRDGRLTRDDLDLGRLDDAVFVDVAPHELVFGGRVALVEAGAGDAGDAQLNSERHHGRRTERHHDGRPRRHGDGYGEWYSDGARRRRWHHGHHDPGQ